MNIHRFHVPSVTGVNHRTRLPDDEAAHATRVLRLSAGATVSVFNGHGREFLGRLEIGTRGEVGVDTLEEVVPTRETQIAITLAQVALKGKSFEAVVKDATMLGVTAIHPLLSANTDVPLSVTTQPSVRTRWERVAVASAKQSGRAFVPKVDQPKSLTDYLQIASDDLQLIFVEPASAHASQEIQILSDPSCLKRATLMVGPEGGWSDEEIALATETGCVAITLGARTLRADAMPIAALSVLFFLSREL